MASSTHTNKWGWQGYNCKWKPAGTGTTHANRRQQRQHLQWNNLEVAEPDKVEDLDAHLEALEKATQRARERREELALEKAKQDEEEEDESQTFPSSSSSGVNYRSRSKRRSKQAKERASSKQVSLEKDKLEKEALEKAQGEGTIRRGRKAKDGSAQFLVMKEEPSEEDGTEDAKPLEKGMPWKKKGHGIYSQDSQSSKDKPLEKGQSSKDKPLEKGASSKPLDKGQSSKDRDAKPLEKGKDAIAKPLEKGKCSQDKAWEQGHHPH